LAKLLDIHCNVWTGTATELLKKLTSLADESVTKSKAWPGRPNTLSGRLTRLAPALRAVRIEVVRDRDQGHTRNRTLRIERAAEDRPESSTSSVPSDPTKGHADAVGRSPVSSDDPTDDPVAGNALDGTTRTIPDDDLCPILPGHELVLPHDRHA